LGETKWTGQGRKKLREGYETIWPGETTENRNGVTIIVNPTYAEMITESECISGRVMKTRILMTERNEHMQLYAPQTQCSNEEKE
jgi:hypothetical protein